MESALYGISLSLVLYQKSHSFAALTRSILDTSPTRVKFLYARPFYEALYILSYVCLHFPRTCVRLTSLRHFAKKELIIWGSLERDWPFSSAVNVTNWFCNCNVLSCNLTLHIYNWPSDSYTNTVHSGA